MKALMDKLSKGKAVAVTEKRNYDALTGKVIAVQHESGLWYCSALVIKDGKEVGIPQGIKGSDGLNVMYFNTKKEAEHQCKVYKKLIKWHKEKQAESQE